MPCYHESTNFTSSKPSGSGGSGHGGSGNGGSKLFSGSGGSGNRGSKLFSGSGGSGNGGSELFSGSGGGSNNVIYANIYDRKEKDGSFSKHASYGKEINYMPEQPTNDRWVKQNQPEKGHVIYKKGKKVYHRNMAGKVIWDTGE
ncbi:MAG: hypothetical protein AAF632_10750 [Bacteroidota bacterium]